MESSKRAIALLSVLVLAASGSMVWGQTSFGSVNGTVTDASGAHIPGASVVLTSQSTNIQTETTTNDVGFFRIVNVRPGRYILSVALPGFKTSSVAAFDVGVNEAVVRNVKMEVGEVSESVEVIAGFELLQASSSELGNVVEEEVIRDLPLNGRNFTQLLMLTPGVNPVSTAQGSQVTINFGAAEGNTGLPGSTIANASIQGQQNRSKIYYIDGIINTSVRGTSYVVLPDIDSLQEFKVQSHNDKAEYGGVTGGVVNMSSKSGTNQFHGSAFEFVRNEIFDARDPFRDRDRKDPPTFRQNQFGANIGGPIIKDKTFFFAAYDGWRYRDVANVQRFVPTVELDGDFSQSRFARDIYNPYTTRIEDGKLVRDIFPNRQIPAELISPMMQGFLKAYMYQPNVPGDPVNNFRLDRARRNDANGLQVRLDHHFSETTNAFFRWNEQHVSSFNPQGDVGFKTPDATNRNLGGGLLHSFSPTLILEVRGGIATQPTEDAPLEHPLGAQPQVQLGLPEINKFAGYVVQLNNNPWFNDQLGVQGPRPRGNPNWNFATDLTWLSGNHSFKSGFQFVHIRRLQRNQFGQINFTQDATRDPQKSGTGDDLASALLGIPSRIQGFVHEFGSIDFGTGTWSAYFQDEWKLKPDLTLTWGLRYDYITRATGEGFQSGPDFTTGEWLIALPQMPAVCTGQAPPCLPSALENIRAHEFIRATGEEFSIIRPVKDNWGPRVGVAWQLNNRTVLRTGYSLMWDSLPSRSQYAQHQFESWGWPQFSGIDTGVINTVGGELVTLQNVGSLPFGLPRAEPWNASGWFNDPDRKDAYSHQWHVEVQREMTNSLMLSLAYVGSQNGRLEYAGFAAGSPVPGIDPATGRVLLPAEVDQLRPWPHINGNFRYEDDIGYSNYHSFQVKGQRRFTNGLATIISYTWQKSIDTSSGWFNAENGIGGGATVQNFYDREANRAVSGYDVPHLLTWGTVWELPFGRGKQFLNEGPASWILGDWQLNWLLLARSGQPFTVEAGGDIANNGVAGQTYGRPNLIGDPNLSNPTADQWYNPSAFQIPGRNGVPHSFGTAGRNLLRVDDVFNVDFGLQRNVSIGEGRKLEFHVQAFNVFNHMDLGNPRTRIDQTFPGRITSISHAPRQLQFGLRFTY